MNELYCYTFHQKKKNEIEKVHVKIQRLGNLKKVIFQLAWWIACSVIHKKHANRDEWPVLLYMSKTRNKKVMFNMLYDK